MAWVTFDPKKGLWAFVAVSSVRTWLPRHRQEVNFPYSPVRLCAAEHGQYKRSFHVITCSYAVEGVVFSKAAFWLFLPPYAVISSHHCFDEFWSVNKEAFFLDLMRGTRNIHLSAILVFGCIVPAGSGTCVSEGVLRLFYICK